MLGRHIADHQMRFYKLILDDLVYVRKDQTETSTLLKFISARYEYCSLLITANQPFGPWDTFSLSRL